MLRYDHIELDSNGILWTTLSECAPAKVTYCTCNLNRLKYLADILLFDLKDASWLVLRLLNMSHLSNKISSLLCSGYVVTPFQMRVSKVSLPPAILYMGMVDTWFIGGPHEVGDGGWKGATHKVIISYIYFFFFFFSFFVLLIIIIFFFISSIDTENHHPR